MKVLFLATVFCFTTVGAHSCSNEDETLLRYIKWQMKTTSFFKESRPGKCECHTEERRTIAFNTRLEKDLENLPVHAVVKFGTVTLNEGNGYNQNTGVFTCPIDGVYSFSWTIITKAGSRFHTEFRLNDSVLAYNYCAGQSTYNSASKTVLAKFKKGDKAHIQVHGSNGKFAWTNWSSFSGNKI